MELSLIEIAKKVITETCKEVNFTTSKPIFIPIKDNKITVSLNSSSLRKADECMLLLPYIWENTVPNYSGYGTVTFKNTLRKLVHIDNEGNINEYGYQKESPFRISCICRSFGATVRLILDFDYKTIYESKHRFPTVEDFHEVWKLYNFSNKLIDFANFDQEREELQSEIEELKQKYSELDKKYKEATGE